MTLSIAHLEISGKDIKEQQLKNIYLILKMTSSLYFLSTNARLFFCKLNQLDILGKNRKEEHSAKIP